MHPSLRRRKCLIGAALVAEIVLFSAVTFVIAYVNSLNAIHHASQQLADSMVDTVAVRVTGYISTTEQSLRNLAVTRRDAMLPEDYGPGGPEWSTEWTLALRTFMLALNYDVFAVAVMLDDASVVSESMWGVTLVRETVIDARRLRSLGYRNLRVSLRPPDTAPRAPQVAWPEMRDYYPRQTPGYYMLKEQFGTETLWCAWTPVLLDPDRDKFISCLTCNVINVTGAFIGETVIVRDIGVFTEFLQQTAVTPNTAIFIYDQTLFLIAATTAAPTSVIYPSNTSNSTALLLRAGCISSVAYSSATPIRVGCRASVHDYPYEPLKSLAASDLDLLQSPTRRSAYRQLTDSMAYYVVCLPVQDASFKRTLRLVLFLPESDVLGNVQQGFVLSIGICVVLCLVGAMLSSFLVMTLIDAPQRRVRTTILQRAVSEADDDCVGVPELLKAYANFVLMCRTFDRACRMDQHRGGEPLAAALRRVVEESTLSLASTTESVRSSSSDRPAARQPAVLLLMTLRVSSRRRSPRSALAASAATRLAIEMHGGRIVDVAASVRNRAILWRIGDADARSETDQPELRAVLCGLALLRLRCASAAVVVRGDVLRYHSDPFRHGTLLQDAEALLSTAEEGAGAWLVASDAVLQRCPSGVLVTADHHEERGNGGRDVTGVVVVSGRNVLERRVHFTEGAASALALLRRAQQMQQERYRDDDENGNTSTVELSLSDTNSDRRSDST